MSNIDFNSIVLTSRELKALKKMKHGFHPDIGIGKHLNQVGFAKWVFRSESGYWKITVNGERYLQYLNNRQHDRKRDSRRYWITTIIAVISLVKSFMPELILLWGQLRQLLKR